MDTTSLRPYLEHTLRETHFDQLGPRYQGKVRDTYRVDERLVLVTTDRISAFDHVLPQAIPLKGQVLNQLAAYFFEHTRDVAPNHVLDVPDPNVTIAQACEPIRVEFVVRGYLAGHAWRVYRDGHRTLCDQPLPDGLRQNSPLPAPMLTPATKAEEGHDEDITREEAIRRGLVTEEEFDRLKEWALALFDRGSEMARDKGLILVDTKYEFGRTEDGELLLIDEVHTPDSSRYFYADTYEERLEADEPQRQLSKEFVREWLMDQGFMGKSGQQVPDLPDSLRLEVTRRYIGLYEQLTGLDFEPAELGNPVRRIRSVLDSIFSLQ